MLAVCTVDIPKCNREGDIDTLHSGGFRLHVSNGRHDRTRDPVEDSASIGESPVPVVDLVQLAGHGQRLGELGQKADFRSIARIHRFSSARRRHNKIVHHIGTY